MIRMSKATRTHTPGKQLYCNILISSLMKHVLTNRPMFHSDLEKHAEKSGPQNLPTLIKQEILRRKVRYIYCP